MLFKYLASSLALAASAIAQSPPGFVPQSLANFPVTYDNATAPTFFVAGGVFNKSSVQYAPHVFIPDISSLKSKTFVILMVDPDAPSPQNQTFSEILHWLQPGVRVASSAPKVKGPDGTTLLKLDTTRVAPLVPYRGSGPPSEAPHRYIFLLFIQPGNTFALPAGYEKYAGGADRRLFDAEAFVDASGLDEPIAGNYFLAGFSTGGDGSQVYTGTDAYPGATTPYGGGYNYAVPNTTNSTGGEGLPQPTEAPNAAARAGMAGWAIAFGILGLYLLA